MARKADAIIEELLQVKPKRPQPKCNHKTTIPITKSGDVIHWRCACGLRRTTVDNKS